jgi:hypothetical protein
MMERGSGKAEVRRKSGKKEGETGNWKGKREGEIGRGGDKRGKGRDSRKRRGEGEMEWEQ